jgi:hypothetical protein
VAGPRVDVTGPAWSRRPRDVARGGNAVVLPHVPGTVIDGWGAPPTRAAEHLQLSSGQVARQVK